MNLTARQQDLLAVLMRRMRSTVKQIDDGGEPRDQAYAVVLEWVLDMGVKPQEIDEIYNLMHRGGANQ